MANVAQTPEPVPVKPWYKSKVALFALTVFAVFGGNLLFGWLGADVSDEQIASIQAAYPTAIEIIEGLKSGESIQNYIGAIFGAVIFIARVWFTDSLIPQSVKK